jgi:zinc transport system permease protein
VPDEFILRAALAGIGVALAAGPLGCFVVWRRMAYIGDATAHAGILGVALSLALAIDVHIGVLAVAAAMALAVSTLTGRTYAADTLLGVGAHSALAFGLVAVSFLPGARIDLMAYLFGDLLAVGRTDLLVIWGGAAAVLALLAARWSALLTATLNPDLAYASGIDPRREQRVLTLTLAIVVAVAIKVVGALLIAAVLIIPAAAARPFARSPEVMAALAALVGGVAVLAGLAASWRLDTPTGPTIVAVAALIFAASNLVRSALPGR